MSLLKEILAEQKKTKSDPELDEMTEVIDAGYIERKLKEQLENPEDKLIAKLEKNIKENIIPKI